MGHSSPDENQQSSPPPRRSGPQPSSPRRAAEAGQPRVWLILGDKRGDNGQVEVVAQALGWVCERKYIAMCEPYMSTKPRMQASLHHIDPTASDALEPPWPDLIITVGRRPSMVALWVREQSGGHTKIVLLGKPSGRVEWYDLIIAGTEIILPPLPNVHAITLPPMQIDEATVASAAGQWRSRLEELPRPLIGFLIGGPTEPFVYSAALIKRLLRAAKDQVNQTGGTPYFTTSRRTPAAVVDALQAGLPPEARLFAWAPGAEDNPYHGLLALADGFVITGDSISMIVEAINVGKPVSILPVPTGPIGTLDQWRRSLVRWLFAANSGGQMGGLRQAAGRLLYRLRVATHTRDFRAFHQILLDRGLAVAGGQGFVSAPGQLPDDMPEAVARIKALMGADQAGVPASDR